ncbi:MAG: TonB family protein [Chitinivibrionia bacterium]|nr:TonB family protein [Chitinivibrionia bacterium]
MASINYAYNQRLKDNPGMQGRVTVKWAIDEFGNVISCKLVGTTINDDTFEEKVLAIIRTWSFGKIDIPGDVTEVEYPFVLTLN